jgi:glycyl-tRNA synthetase
VIEPAAGATRTMMAFLMAAYDEEEVRGETRTVLRLHPRLAPYKVAVLPLSKKPELTGPAEDLLARLQPHVMCDYDETQNIGKRYRRQDELGTPLCITYDFDSIEDHAVTVRDRDSMAQERVPIDSVVEHVQTRLAL